MEIIERKNETLIVEFILLGFGNAPELQPLLFLLFLAIYMVTMVGNILLIVLVVVDQHLHTPMYFFLANLSSVEICFTSIILPILLASLMTGDRTISVKCCLVQTYFFAIVATTENLLLSAMSYDRYLAICNPLRYAALMNGRVCFQLVAGCWAYSCVVVGTLNYFLFTVTFCSSKEIDHFFCDFSPMIKLACGDIQALKLLTFTVSTIGTVVPLLMTVTSYIYIIRAILRIPSTIGRQKAFSTCSSHLIVVSILYMSLFTVYVFPTSNTPMILNKIFSLFQTVLTPMLNPFIYSLRNKGVKESLRKNILKLVAFRNRQRNLMQKF